jgi:hypothetical protein
LNPLRKASKLLLKIVQLQIITTNYIPGLIKIKNVIDIWGYISPFLAKQIAALLKLNYTLICFAEKMKCHGKFYGV